MGGEEQRVLIALIRSPLFPLGNNLGVGFKAEIVELDFLSTSQQRRRESSNQVKSVLLPTL